MYVTIGYIISCVFIRCQTSTCKTDTTNGHKSKTTRLIVKNETSLILTAVGSWNIHRARALPCEGPSDAVGPSTLYSGGSALILSLFDVHFAESVGLKPICPPPRTAPNTRKGWSSHISRSGVNSLADRLSDGRCRRSNAKISLHGRDLLLIWNPLLKTEVFKAFASWQNIYKLGFVSYPWYPEGHLL